jgi:stage III sporulation protein AC
MEVRKMELDSIFKIAGIGILTAVLHSVLKSVGKEDLASLATLAGLAVVLYMVIDLLSELFIHVRTVFMLY